MLVTFRAMLVRKKVNCQLSIIVPAYRVEHTLDRCIRSVLSAFGAAEGLQVVLVDDGSPDRSPAICDEWAARDPRIEVLHRANGGLSAARNSGLDIARGAWIAFVDSDDVILSPPPLPTDKTDADIIEFPVCRHCATDAAVHLAWGDCSYGSAADYWRATEGWLHCYAWNKFYRRELFDGVRFPEGRVFEDVWTIPVLLKRARRIRTVVEGEYGYMDNPGGITMTAGGRQLTDLLEGNVEAARLLGVCDVRHYASMVNIQIDVYRLTGKMPVALPAPTCGSRAALSWTDRLKLLLPPGLLCRLHRLISSKPKTSKPKTLKPKT